MLEINITKDIVAEYHAQTLRLHMPTKIGDDDISPGALKPEMDVFADDEEDSPTAEKSVCSSVSRTDLITAGVAVAGVIITFVSLYL